MEELAKKNSEYLRKEISKADAVSYFKGKGDGRFWRKKIYTTFFKECFLKQMETKAGEEWHQKEFFFLLKWKK